MGVILTLPLPLLSYIIFRLIPPLHCYPKFYLATLSFLDNFDPLPPVIISQLLADSLSPCFYSIFSYNLYLLLFEKKTYFQTFLNPIIEMNSVTKTLLNIFPFVKLINICNSSPNHTVSCLLTYMWEGFLILRASNF